MTSLRALLRYLTCLKNKANYPSNAQSNAKEYLVLILKLSGAGPFVSFPWRSARIIRTYYITQYVRVRIGWNA